MNLGVYSGLWFSLCFIYLLQHSVLLRWYEKGRRKRKEIIFSQTNINTRIAGGGVI
jgi:hypothetical protein